MTGLSREKQVMITMPQPQRLSLIRIIWLAMLTSCLLLVTACGSSSVPNDVITQALTYQMTQGPGTSQALIGHKLLSDYTQVCQVRVRKDQVVTIPVKTVAIDQPAQIQPIEAHRFEGSYTLVVSPPESRNYYRRQNPFKLTLIQTDAEANWVLAYPVLGSNPPIWKTVEFLPEPELPLAPPDEIEEEPETSAEEPIEEGPEAAEASDDLALDEDQDTPDKSIEDRPKPAEASDDLAAEGSIAAESPPEGDEQQAPPLEPELGSEPEAEITAAEAETSLEEVDQP